MKYISMNGCRHRVVDGQMLTVCGQLFDETKLVAESRMGIPLCLDCEEYAASISGNHTTTIRSKVIEIYED